MSWRSLRKRAHDVRGKRIWITGASSGIGAELAVLLARQDNRVIVSARSADRLDALRAQLPGQIDVLACDVASEVDMLRAGRELAARYGAIDMLVINAGICEYIDVGGGEQAVDLASMQRVFDVNFFGGVHALNAALPLLRAARDLGHSAQPLVVGVSSLSTYTAFARAQAYGASKAALRYFLESMRIDLAREHIGVTIVSPGFVDTPLTAQNDFPMPTMIDAPRAAQEIAGAMAARVLEHAFPQSLANVLRLARALPSLWFGVAAPRLARNAARADNTRSNNMHTDNSSEE